MCREKDPIGAQLRAGVANAIVVVVGGRGAIGSQTVKLFAAYGATVIVGTRRGREVLIRTPEDDAAIYEIGLDVSDPRSIRRAADQIGVEFERVDILVNTAGSSVQLPLEALDRLTDSLVDRVLSETLSGPMRLMRDFAPLLKRGNDPVVVNLSSIAAVTGGGSNLAYAAGKAGLDTLARGMAKALAPSIRVVNVSPSALDTDFVQGRTESFLQATRDASALSRLATPLEVATAVICAARLLTATTGVTLVTDAGRQL